MEHCGALAGPNEGIDASTDDARQKECLRTSRMSLSMLLGTPTTATLTPRRQHSSWMALAACDEASVRNGTPGSQQRTSRVSGPTTEKVSEN